ncbi:MAG: hypothetical protein PHF17_05600 [Arcobacteraceae bacterium]|jgi:hypothetical protein|nr:hypothetical protein [Arcobacteraceae bacterium]
MRTKLLNRAEYLDSVTKMDHFESLKFAKQSLLWWDQYYSWTKSPCLCLEDNGFDVCYLFYAISKDNKYLTIHNLLTPFIFRFQGYGKELLTILLNQILLDSKIERIKMLCVSTSLDFYMSLGIDFWGVTKIGQYYTEFPMPQLNINEIPQLMQTEHLSTLTTLELNSVYEKLNGNGSLFNLQEKDIFNRALITLGERYRYEELYDMIHQKL